MDVGTTRTDRLIQTALGALSLRQRVITDNVANASTPGFKASAVEFERALQRALTQRDAGADVGSADAVTPKVVTDMLTTRGVDGNNVDIDQQMVDLAQTNITYNALAQLEAARLRVLRSVISEGPR
jgi:flagellar basal-body rod protein FlgB